jgi:hypothetical protein
MDSSAVRAAKEELDKASSPNFKIIDINGNLLLAANKDTLTLTSGEGITIAGNQYSVGYSKIIEDDDDWGQAESQIVEWTRCNGEHISPEKVIEIVSNYKILERDFKLNKLGI